MVKTHLPSHMDSVREEWRPKHQLLILKCYPRLPKNSTADVSPNGSELSYLLYYASTRRSKLQKVGAFLERKTAADVSKSQSARVVVTMQILTALLENKVVGSDSSFGLLAPYVMRIIKTVLAETADVSLADACLSTWEVFCKHQDQATLGAEHEYRSLYEQIVRQWSLYAKKEPAKRLGKSTNPVSIPDAIRLRKAGLGAIKALLVPDNLSSETGRQLSQGIPAILTNLRGISTLSLSHLLTLSKRHEDEEKENRNRRQSMATVRPFSGNESTLSDPRAAEGTIQDADAYAEEETAVMAIDCLRRAFESDNRPQIRAATSQVLFFLAFEHIVSLRNPKTDTTTPADWTTWSSKLFEMIVKWTPVQDRFIVLVTTSETLLRLPLSEESVNQHLLLTQLIDDILRSELNLIGLSVMDVLLGFIQQILRVLQLGSVPNLTPSGNGDVTRTATNNTVGSTADTQKKLSAITPSTQMHLLHRLKSCIADLATHVYYTDQIPDMIAAILLRLKPNATATNPPSAADIAAAIQEPSRTVNDSSSQVNLTRERTQASSLPGGFFSFDAARQIALESVKEIMVVANSSRSHTSAGMAQSRNLVSLTVWEGTQWLLRDPVASVRRAYVDAICTWLMLETRNTDSRVREVNEVAKSGNANGSATRRRNLSNASSTEKQGRKARNTFLKLLHLAVYENALQHAATSEPDMLLLHLLLVSMAPRLGVNAVQSALPMIFALQEEIPRMSIPTAKIRLGSLVHGYLWQLTEQFEFTTDSVGREIFNEINRRKQHGLWVTPLNVPATPLDRIPHELRDGAPMLGRLGIEEEPDNEALRPFDRRQQLVDNITNGYAYAAANAQPTTPGSPGRHTGPILDRHASSYLSVKQVTSLRLPEKIVNAMLITWTKEECLASISAAGPRTPSLSGSNPGNQPQAIANNHRQLLGAATNSGPPPRGDPSASSTSLKQELTEGRPSGINPASSADGGERRMLKVNELKQVLAGGNDIPLIGRFDVDDSGSDSMVEVGPDDVSDVDSHAPSERDFAYRSGIAAPGDDGKGKATVLNGRSVRNGSIHSARHSMRSSVYSSQKGKGVRRDLASLLDAIEVGNRSGRMNGSGRPPY